MIKTPKLNVIENLVKQVNPYVITDELIIPVWRKRDGVHIAPNEYSFNPGGEAELSLGDTWETGYDMTSWFSAKVIVPEEMDGKKLYLRLDFGGEALVRINGAIKGAVSSRMNSGWVHRDIIHLDNPARKGTVYNIELEATVNSGGFCDAAMAGAKTVFYTLNTASLIAVNTDIEKYRFLLKNCVDAISVIPDEIIKNRLWRAVDDSVHALDFDMGQTAFSDSVVTAVEILRNSIACIPRFDYGRVIMTGHSHLDVAWLWTIKEIVRKTARTFANNLSLMDLYPDFRFSQSQAVLYDFMKTYYPDIFERIKEKVKSGQWEITGCAWVEADTNIAGGEALIRQLLYGRQFFLKEFGICSEIYWLPDCFGFSWALPQIIKKSKLKYFLTSKLLSNDTNKFPYSQFIWRSHSGDEVISYLMPTGYGGEYTASDIQKCFYGAQQTDITGVSLGMFGYGDGGGGCTYGMVENARALAEIPGLVPSCQGSATEFFSLIEKKKNSLPVWDDELYYENHRGTYTSQAFVKKYNRKGELLFRNAELLSVIAFEKTGFEYDLQGLEKGWKLLLTNQFHDILPGTSIHEVYEDCLADYEKMMKIGSDIKYAAISSLKPLGNSPAVIVWNFNTWTVSSSVSVEIPETAGSIKDALGNKMPSIFYKKDGKLFIEFIAQDVPSVGYKMFFLSRETPQSLPLVTATETLLENEILRVTLDSQGNISGIEDKRSGRQLLTGTGNLLTVFQDKPVHESAWNLEIDINKKFWDLTVADSITVKESSPLKGVIRIKRHFGKSVITQDIILKKNSDMLLFNTVVDWQETEKTLKASFPVDIRATEASYEIAHGAINRPNHFNTSYDFARFEVSAHKWADLSQTDYGVSILNDCKYGYDIHGNRMRITLMRSPNCPDTTADRGINEFTYAFYPHSNRWQDGKTVNKAFELNMPLEAFYSEGSDNSRAVFEKSFLELSCQNIIVDALKKAQDGEGFILRVYESEGRTSQVSLKLCFPKFDLFECDMMENSENLLEKGAACVQFKICPYEVKTFRLIPVRPLPG